MEVMWVLMLGYLFLALVSAHMVEFFNLEVTANIDSAELGALQDLYISTNGTGWKWYNITTGAIWDFSVPDPNPCFPVWQGITCDCDNSTCRVVELDLTQHELAGPIPDSIGNLSALTKFDLSYNRVEGTIPLRVGNMVNLTFFHVEYNYKLNGSFPEALANLKVLEDLALSGNRFTGTLPSFLYSLPKLTNLLLLKNRFSGTLSSDIEKLRDLEFLELGFNNLTGTIPPTFGSMVKLLEMRMSDNNFTGTIPEELCKMHVVEMHISTNSLVGSIPSCISEMPFLASLILNNNRLNGSLPDSLCQLTLTMDYFSVYSNYLTGTIPANFFNTSGSRLALVYMWDNRFTGPLPEIYLPNVLVLAVAQNYLSGTLSASLSNCSHMIVFDIIENMISGTVPSFQGLKGLNSILLQYNHLSGPLPFVVDVFGQVSDYVLGSNQFTGPIPEAMNNNSIQYFEIDNNLLTGTLPRFVFSEHLRYIEISNNSLTGTIPSTLDTHFLVYFGCSNNSFHGNLPIMGGSDKLETYYAQNNQFTGQLPFVRGPFPTAVNFTLKYIDISNNQLTGTIPEDAQVAVPWISFSASSNCLTGTIPKALCNATKMLFLDLDGLSTSSSCRKPIFPNTALTSFTLNHEVTGGIPHCLFSMAHLQTLHLSGNGIKWSFPQDINISKSITDMTISHNRLTGTIPDAIQKSSQWKTLDLSFNRLSGTLDFTDQQDDASIVLQVNRLSGNVPDSLLNLKSINILTGNLFSCDVQRDQLPVHDNAYHIYQCGSNAFDEAVILWLCCGGVAVLVGFAVWFSRNYWHRQFVIWFKNTLQLIEVYKNEKSQSKSKLIAFYDRVSTFRTFLTLMTIGILVIFIPVYPTLKLFYGTVAHQYAWTVSAAFLGGRTPAIVLFAIYVCIITLQFVMWNIRPAANNSKTNDAEKPSISKRIILVLVVFINCVVMIVANGGYVLIILNFDSSIIFTAQICIALFKLLWNDFALRSMITQLRRAIGVYIDDPELKKIRNDATSANEMLPYLNFIVLFNSIIAPCLATAVVDSNCFYNAFIAPQSVTTEFPYLDNIAVCTYSATEYREQCVDVATTNEMEVTYNPPFIYNYQCSSSILTNYAAVYVFMFLFSAFIKPIALCVMVIAHRRLVNHWSHKYVSASMMKLLKPPRDEDLEDDGKLLFEKVNFVLRSVSKLAVFATFGLVFPLLAVVILVSFVSESWMNVLMIGRFLVAVEDESSKRLFRERLGRECEGSVELLMESLFKLVVPFAALFYSLFVFDIYGDKEGYKKALWAPVVLVVYPLVLRLGQRLIRWCRSRCGKKSVGEGESGENEERGTEMNDKRGTELSDRITTVNALHDEL